MAKIASSFVKDAASEIFAVKFHEREPQAAPVKFMQQLVAQNKGGSEKCFLKYDDVLLEWRMFFLGTFIP